MTLMRRLEPMRAHPGTRRIHLGRCSHLDLHLGQFLVLELHHTRFVRAHRTCTKRQGQRSQQALVLSLSLQHRTNASTYGQLLSDSRKSTHTP